MAEGKLNKEQQIFVIQRLAVFEKPQKVLDELKQIYPDVDVTLQAIVRYDLSHPNFPKRFAVVFESARKEFLEKTEKIPIANKSYRVQKLQNMLDKKELEKIQNDVEIRATLKQAAEEMGDAYTNRRELSGLGGEPIQHSVVRVPPKLTADQWKQQSQTTVPASDLEQ